MVFHIVPLGESHQIKVKGSLDFTSLYKTDLQMAREYNSASGNKSDVNL